jgi:hypothetical protein
MISGDDIEAFMLPDWASMPSNGDYTVPNTALWTKDGRRCGNAVMIGISNRQYEDMDTFYKIVTDAGSILNLNEKELMQLFHPPEYIMARLLPAHIKALEEEEFS